MCPLPLQGIIVDGHLMGAPSKHGAEERPRTYFDRLTISSATAGSGDIMITLSLDRVVVEGEGQDILPINQQGSVTRQGVTVAVDNHRSCWIELTKDIRFLVLFHHYKHPSYLQMPHLGFYITHGRGLSASTQGLLGMCTSATKDYFIYDYFLDSSIIGLVYKMSKNGKKHQSTTVHNSKLFNTVTKPENIHL